MKTGNTVCTHHIEAGVEAASMEPGHEDREYRLPPSRGPAAREASMEPGHEDREYQRVLGQLQAVAEPQWSPVMKTGNTRGG